MSTLSDTLANITIWGNCFPSARYVFVTNDNSDSTTDILRRWLIGKEDVAKVIVVDGAAGAINNKIDRLAFARNSYLLHLNELTESGSKVDFLIVADMDGPNRHGPSGACLVDAIEQAPSDWAGLFPCQDGGFYDVSALRHDTWCPTDAWAEVAGGRLWRLLRLQYSPSRIQRYVHCKQVYIDPSESPIAVNSAFGGFAVYRVSALAASWYGSRDPAGRTVCEHVVFHAAVRDAGGGLYVMPCLRNDAPLEHLGNGSGAKRRPWVRAKL